MPFVLLPSPGTRTLALSSNALSPQEKNLQEGSSVRDHCSKNRDLLQPEQEETSLYGVWWKHNQAPLSLSLSLSLSFSPICAYLHILFFPPNKHFTCSTTFRLSVETHLYTADGPGLCHWPLVPGGLVARIQRSHCCGLASIFWFCPKPCFKPLQDEATWDHLHYQEESQ